MTQISSKNVGQASTEYIDLALNIKSGDLTPATRLQLKGRREKTLATGFSAQRLYAIPKADFKHFVTLSIVASESAPNLAETRLL